MQRRTIYLIRHGDIGLNGEQRYIGQADMALSPAGIKQAQNLQNRFCEVALAGIYCSDLKRSRQTAEIIAAKRSIQPMVYSGLREMNLGKWEGKTFTEIKETFPQEFAKRGADIANYRTPGGESFSDCLQRVMPVLQAIVQASQGDILLVSHAGVIKAILCHIMGWPLTKVLSLRQSYGCYNVIQYSASGYHLASLNQIPLN